MSEPWNDPLLPQNQTRLEAAVGRAMTPRPNPGPMHELWDAEHCPAHILPWLAWALSVDEWDDEWPESVQRTVILESIALHRKKGTLWAVRRALAQTGMRGTVVEWWQESPRGVPHTFRVDVELGDRALDPDAIAAIERRIDAAKPVRSHYALRVLATVRTPIRHAAAIVGGDTVAVMPYGVASVTLPPAGGTRHAATIQSWMTTEVRPQ